MIYVFSGMKFSYRLMSVCCVCMMFYTTKYIHQHYEISTSRNNFNGFGNKVQIVSIKGKYKSIIEGKEQILQELKGKTFIQDNFYSARITNKYFRDTDVSLWQTTTYYIAAELARRLNSKFIIDLGCGRAYKLSKADPHLKLICVDFKDNLIYSQTHYKHIHFIEVDFEGDASNCSFLNTIKHQLTMSMLANSVVISADVIEHIRDPQGCYFATLKYILLYAPVLLLSTPDRSLMYGKEHKGPPLSQYHVREHTLSEMELMLAAHDMYPILGGFECKHFDMCNKGYSLSTNTYANMLITILNTNIRKTWMNSCKTITITAFLIVHPHTRMQLIHYNVHHLLKQDIQVILVSYVTGMDHLFPGNVHIKYISDINEAKTVIITHINSKPYTENDWFIINDAHEVLTTLRDPYVNSRRSLRDMICHINKRLVYNALAVSSVFLHTSTGGKWEGDHVFKIHSKGPWDNGTFETLIPSNQPEYNIKIWKNNMMTHTHLSFEISVTSMLTKTIHDVQFENRKIFPLNIIGWRYHPQMETIKTSTMNDLFLEQMYTFELALLFCQNNRSPMIETAWLY